MKHVTFVPWPKAAGQWLAMALWLIVCASAALADGGWARHDKIYVVPRTKPVVIDGKLNDWDLSGQLWIYAQSETAEMQSAHFAMMYDNEALYVGGLVRDTSPMMNRHDPEDVGR